MRTCFATILILFSANLFALEDIVVEDPWINLSPPGIKNNAGYMTITNNRSEEIVLKSISSPEFGKAHIHETRMTNEEMKMIPLDDLTIQPGTSVAFEPGGLHIMLMHRSESIYDGDGIELNLNFSDGGDISLNAIVKRPE